MHPDFDAPLTLDPALWDLLPEGLPCLRLRPKWYPSLGQLAALLQTLEQLGHSILRTEGFHLMAGRPVLAPGQHETPLLADMRAGRRSVL